MCVETFESGLKAWELWSNMRGEFQRNEVFIFLDCWFLDGLSVNQAHTTFPPLWEHCVSRITQHMSPSTHSKSSRRPIQSGCMHSSVGCCLAIASQMWILIQYQECVQWHSSCIQMGKRGNLGLWGTSRLLDNVEGLPSSKDFRAWITPLRHARSRGRGLPRPIAASDACMLLVLSTAAGEGPTVLRGLWGKRVVTRCRHFSFGKAAFWLWNWVWEWANAPSETKKKKKMGTVYLRAWKR